MKERHLKMFNINSLNMTESRTEGKTFFFFLFLPAAYQSSQARSGIRATVPQPQQLVIQAASATYTTAHCNAGSLTRWSRPGIEPTSSWIPVRFVSTPPQQELQELKKI